mgnify:CR=1 FL=1
MLKHGVLRPARSIKQFPIAELRLPCVAITATVICPKIVRFLVCPCISPASNVTQNRCFIVAIAPRPLHLTRLALGKITQWARHKHLARFAHVFRLGVALHLLAGCLGWCLAFLVYGARVYKFTHFAASFNLISSHRTQSPAQYSTGDGSGIPSDFMQSVARE